MHRILRTLVAVCLIWAGPALADRYTGDGDGESGSAGAIGAFVGGLVLGAWVVDQRKSTEIARLGSDLGRTRAVLEETRGHARDWLEGNATDEEFSGRLQAVIEGVRK